MRALYLVMVGLLVAMLAGSFATAGGASPAAGGPQVLPAHMGAIAVSLPEAGKDNVAIRPSVQNTYAGYDFSVEVRIEGDVPVVSSDVQITFDTSFLQGVQVVSSGAFQGFFTDHSDFAHGVVWFGGGAPPGQGNFVQPPFTFATIHFRAKQNLGSTALTFNPAETDVNTTGGGSVVGSLLNGTVDIGPAPTSTPTFTPSKTPTATNTPTRTPTVTPTHTPVPGSVCVVTFDDANGNQRRDAGEPLVAGALITVLDANLSQVATYTTDAVHEPKCFALGAGTFYIEETDPPGYGSTGPNAFGIVLNNQSSISIAFADQPATTPTSTPTGTVVTEPYRSVEGVVWNDLNRDGVRQPAEPGIPGVDVYLRENSVGTAIRADYHTKSGADGSYQITNIQPGTYILAVPALAGFWPTTGLAVGVIIGPNVSVRADFGFYHPSVILFLPLTLHQN